MKKQNLIIPFPVLILYSCQRDLSDEMGSTSQPEHTDVYMGNSSFKIIEMKKYFTPQYLFTAGVSPVSLIRDGN
jgi:hypothetical protein